MSLLLESVFLHEGHIALGSPSFDFGTSSEAGVELDESDGLFAEVSNVNFTGISCLRLKLKGLSRTSRDRSSHTHVK